MKQIHAIPSFWKLCFLHCFLSPIEVTEQTQVWSSECIPFPTTGLQNNKSETPRVRWTRTGKANCLEYVRKEVAEVVLVWHSHFQTFATAGLDRLTLFPKLWTDVFKTEESQ